MAWKVSLRTSDSGQARSITGALENLLEPPPDAVSQFVEGPAHFRIEAYFAGFPDAAAMLRRLEQVLGPGIPPLAVVDVPDLDWVRISQAALPPVTAGRFLVHGTHDRGKVPHGPNAILIDAGEAFGTAHHASTQGCLMMIDRIGRSAQPGRVLDLGCGSGVLAIAAARAFRGALILASDNDPKAVAVATDNARANGVGQRIAFVCADGLAHAWLRHAAPFDLIVANILAAPLSALAPRLRVATARGGTIVLGGLLDSEAPEVIAGYAAQGFALAERISLAGWTTLRLRSGGARRVAEAAKRSQSAQRL